MWKQRYIHKCFTNMTTYNKIKWFTLPEHFNEKKKNKSQRGTFFKVTQSAISIVLCAYVRYSICHSMALLFIVLFCFYLVV